MSLHHQRLRALSLIIFLTSFGQMALAVAQTGIQGRPTLPPPTGEFTVGRMSLDLVDTTREEPFAQTAGAKRRIVVHVWYPVDRSAVIGHTPAPYLPGFEQVKSKLSDGDIKGLFRPAIYTGPMSLPITEVFEGVPFTSKGEKFPLILFSHGWGNPNFLYTAELQDIVSHGYVVVAVDHPYDTTYTQFSDGTVALFAQQAFNDATKKPNGFNDYARQRVEIMAQDNHFALTEILKLSSSKAGHAPFFNRIDEQKIAAIGHSIGGLAAARTCQIDLRVRACMDQDSVDYRGSAFAVSDLNTTEDQPFFLFVVASADIWSSKMVNPTNQDLAAQKLTRVAYGNLIRGEEANQDRQLDAVKGGAYRLMLFNIPDFTHRSFTDQTLLATSISHENALHNFNVIQSYTLAFLGKYLNNTTSLILDSDKQVDERAVLETFQKQ